jgi:hypothetical protein
VPDEIIGREEEQSRLVSLVGGRAAGGAALVLRGRRCGAGAARQAGVGKSTLLTWAARQAPDTRTLRAA